jgi:3D (Asp-Asp-Asp) domain-containing protein
MKKFVRGGSLLTVLSLCGVFYAQTGTVEALSSANYSQIEIENSDIEEPKQAVEESTEQVLAESQQQDDKAKGSNKKVVKKTVSTRSTAGGSFTATAYCLKGRTALGHGVRRGIIAADPRVLRLGSRINLGAGAYSGEYLVSDTGGAVKGRKIDIWMPSCAEARRFGRRTVTINPL